MKTLDDRIILELSADPEEYGAGVYPYFVYRIPEGNLIFAGNFYYNGVDEDITFDITDIVASDGFVIRENDFNIQDVYEETYAHTIGNKLLNRYYIKVQWDEDTQDTSYAEFVAKVYSYRNKNLGALPFFDTNAYENEWSITRVGDKLIPHYPLHNNSKCPFGLSFVLGSDVTGLTTEFKIDNYRRIDTIADVDSTYSLSHISSVGEIAKYVGIIPLNDGVLNVGNGLTPGYRTIQVLDGNDFYVYIRYEAGDVPGAPFPYCFAYVPGIESINDPRLSYDNIDITDLGYANDAKVEVGDTLYSKPNGEQTWALEVTDSGIRLRELVDSKTAAIFDVCPKRYYLFWQDRYGSFQCQPFNDYANYSETFTKTEVQDYQNRRRNANIQVEGKWKLNSGWIDEKLYPYYESIYTSQILILFDVEQNERFTVMVSGNYDEKTYRNQKKMINMNLELTENKKQNIIY